MSNETIFEDTHIVDSAYIYDKKLTELKESFVMNSKAKFYYEGTLKMNNNKVSIRSLKIISTNMGYLLDYIHGRALPSELKIKKIVNFVDTSAFEIFINKYQGEIYNNELELNSDMITYLNSIVVNYDGKINNLVPETMAVNIIEAN